MGTIKAPNLHSLSRRGRLAATFTYARNQYQHYAYQFVDRRRPPNPFPSDQRLAVREITHLWKSLEDSTRQSWKAYAARQRLPRYTAFVRYNLQRFFRQLPFSPSPPY